jgi:hypothetical protein
MRAWLNVIIFILVAAAAYAGSAQLTAMLSGPVFATECHAKLFNVTCILPAGGPPEWRGSILAAALVAVFWVWAALFAKDWILFPFILLFGTLALGAISYDLTFQNALVSGAKLINDTFNVLRLLIFASFTLTFIMARRSGLTLPGTIVAVVLSYAAALGAAAAFISVQAALFGAFELFVLYIVYAFGGFTLHLMTLSLLVAGARPPAQEMSRSGRPPARIG